MRIELINWSGHGNLGDDAIAEILLRNIPDSVNAGENPSGNADWYILGGGTLITPLSKFLKIMPKPERTIGISLGVSDSWQGQDLEILKRMRKIYTRDYFSHKILERYGVENTLSFDLLCEIGEAEPRERKGVWGNFLQPFPCLKIDRYFALSPDEDMKAMPEAKLYTSAVELREHLSSAETIFATRLHANVTAWLSGCQKIYPIPYSLKIIHFWERMKEIKIKEAQKTIKKHLEEICRMCQ